MWEGLSDHTRRFGANFLTIIVFRFRQKNKKKSKFEALGLESRADLELRSLPEGDTQTQYLPIEPTYMKIGVTYNFFAQGPGFAPGPEMGNLNFFPKRSALQVSSCDTKC